MTKPIAIIPKNKGEELRVSLDQFNGHELFSARVWFEASNGTKKPGKQGLAIRVALLPEFAQAVGEAMAEAKARGLI